MCVAVASLLHDYSQAEDKIADAKSSVCKDSQATDKDVLPVLAAVLPPAALVSDHILRVFAHLLRRLLGGLQKVKCRLHVEYLIEEAELFFCLHPSPH